ncbi:MAG: hypothetical protein JXB49_15565 [Bacteroidales bacterium]|nr:hypothetical protein [Bacteroidales bacterium]
MKKEILFILTIISFQLYGQESDKLQYEQLSINYFTDSIAPQLDKFRIMTDGTIFNRGIDRDYIKHLVDEFYMGIFRQNRDNEKIYKKYWTAYERLSRTIADTTKLISIDSINYQDDRLRVNRPLIEKRRVNYKDLKGGFFRFYGKKVYNFIFKDRYILDITRQVYFDNKHWIRLRLDRPDLEYGQVFILRFDNEGKLIDYSEMGWIQ